MKTKVDSSRVTAIRAALDHFIPEPRCELKYHSPFELLIAVILSAQCTDKRVNMVTPHLFKRFPGPQELAGADAGEVESIIHSTGFFRNKAKNIIGAARTLVRDFDSKMPNRIDDLLLLPGVARKTANVVLGECFGIADGVVVDTHVARITRLLRLTRHTDARRIEVDLMKLIPRDGWIRFSHQIILHGRATCIARRPKCDSCFLAEWCPSRTKSALT